ncbi:BON domain-containing protein [Cupriavidus consociatus]|uniref:BON domain-containing protein n=1 Tax=Cupriavidus consociatus TaxID=2821357 RepID=UPI001AE0EE1C|nr:MULTISPECIES: BON domain-containing protein [unclassified Cupriavidus]MBP0620587.1 BON domain-containing protein [Cupriavidus sp. LEh25]MDK2657247.1 BON domain-containing protein [Cupriavidus sp. LEh21]
MHPFRNQGSSSWWRDEEAPHRQGADDPRGYGEGRYGQSGGPARDYGEGRYEGRQRHGDDVRGQGYYGSRQGESEDWQRSGRRAPWDEDEAWRGSASDQGGNVRDEWGESRGGQAMTGRQGGMTSRRSGYEQGYSISDYASPGAQTRRARSGSSSTTSYGWESGRDEDDAGRTGMSERLGSSGRSAGDFGTRGPGAGRYGQPLRGRDRVGPKGYQRSDERIREEICERLAHARHVDVQDVEVDVEGGVVRLSGNVRDRREKYCIEDIADDVFGVREVHNGIRMGSAGPFGVSGISEGVGDTRRTGSAAGGREHVSGVSSAGSATGSTASSYGGGMEAGSGGPGAGRDSTGGTRRI